MKTLTWEEAADWANRVGLNATVERVVQEFVVEGGKKERSSSIQKSIGYEDGPSTVHLTLPTPKLPYQVAYLADALLPYTESSAIKPCLLWLTDWGIWGEASERVAKTLVECFRATRGEGSPLIERPAHVFDSSEAVDAQTLLTIAIVFGWDCYVIPEHGAYYALTSHDGYLDVISSNPVIHDRFTRELEMWRS